MASQAMQIVAQKLQEIARVADALDTTTAHLAEAHRKQQLMIQQMRRAAERDRAARATRVG